MIDSTLPPGEPKSVKLSFELTPDQAGPFPIAVESLWCDIEGKNYRVRNVPFCIDGISYEDVISVSRVSIDLVRIDAVVEPSRNSTIWLYFKDEAQGKPVLEALQNLGCGVEGGVIEGYFAMNVPEAVNINAVNAVVNRAEERGFISFDCPSMRHVTE